MDFSDTTNMQGLLQDVDFLARSTSASYPVNDKTRNINQAYQKAVSLIWESADDWQYDDSNATDLPKTLTNLTHNTASYAVPSTSQKIHRIEIKDSQGEWYKLNPIDYKDLDVALDEFYSEANRPIHYDLVGNYVTLYPAPSSAYTTLASGMCMRVSRDVTLFPTSATTAVPGFAPNFHRYLSVCAALDFVPDNQDRQLLVGMKTQIEADIKRFYSSRGTERRPQIRPRGKKFWRTYQ